MTDIVLVSPPSRMINHFRPPLALLYVAEWYRSQGKTVKIVDVPMDRVIRDKSFFKDYQCIVKGIKDIMIDKIKEIDPKEVGISCYSTELAEVKDFQNSIRYPVVVGGIHPTLHPEDFGGVKIMQGRTDNGIPAYDLIDMEYYTNANPYAIRGLFTRPLHVMSGIGCPSNCAFCVASTLKHHFGIGKFKTAQEFAQQIKELKDKYEFDSFYIVDDLFTIDTNYVLAFCDAIRGSGLIWGCQAKVPTLKDELVKEMARSGCVQIDFGIERGSDESLKAIRKGQTIDQIRRAFGYCKKYKVRTLANFLINIEGETEDDRQDIERLIEELRPDVVSVNVYSHYEGSQLQESGDKGLGEYATRLNKRYNSVLRTLLWHFRPVYLMTLIRSRRKWNYVKMFGTLLREAINQRTQ